MAQITTNAAKINLPAQSKTQAPAGAPQVLDFTTQTTYTVSLLIFQQQGNIGGVQSMFVDNRDSTGELQISFQGSQQRICIPAKSQAYLPIVSPNPIQYSATVASGGAANVLILLLNYVVNPQVWTLS